MKSFFQVYGQVLSGSRQLCEDFYFSCHTVYGRHSDRCLKFTENDQIVFPAGTIKPVYSVCPGRDTGIQPQLQPGAGDSCFLRDLRHRVPFYEK
jgi:hypothetical protein